MIDRFGYGTIQVLILVIFYRSLPRRRSSRLRMQGGLQGKLPKPVCLSPERWPTAWQRPDPAPPNWQRPLPDEPGLLAQCRQSFPKSACLLAGPPAHWEHLLKQDLPANTDWCVAHSLPMPVHQRWSQAFSCPALMHSDQGQVHTKSFCQVCALECLYDPYQASLNTQEQSWSISSPDLRTTSNMLALLKRSADKNVGHWV